MKSLFRRHINVRKFIFLGVTLLVIFPIFNILAQDTDTTNQPVRVYVCVERSPGNTYLIEFRDTGMFGFIAPEDANVVVYSEEVFRAEVHTIEPDARTGGYNRSQLIVRAEAILQSDLTYEDSQYSPPCAADLNIADSMRSTIPLAVSSDRVVTIRLGTQNNFEAFLGVYSFHFSPFRPEAADFQIIQMEGRSIEVSFPFLSETDENTSFVLVANKTFEVGLSSINDNQVFPGASDSFERQNLIDDDLSPRGLNLFEIMEIADVRIFPQSGHFGEYRPSAYLLLEASDAAAIRSPQFEVGTAVRPLSGASAQLFLQDRGDMYSSLTDQQDEVVDEIQDGEPIFIVNDIPLVIETWLVEPVIEPE